MAYDTIEKDGSSVIEVKRSKFIGIVAHVTDAGEAEALLYSQRKKYFDAKHHCSAYIIRAGDDKPDIIHSSDDGEPSGSAGAPMLDLLQRRNLKDVAAVVTRYFGGTLLGTGGLVRAYSEALNDALNDAVIVTLCLMQRFSVVFDYTYTGIIDHYISENGISRLDAVYTDKTEYLLAAQAGSFDKVFADIIEMTSSTALIKKLEMIYA